MRAGIIGAGSVGRSIAKELLAHGHKVTIIDHDPEAMRVASVSKADWILGDGCSPEILESANLSDCEVLVAATGDDRANLVVSLLAKTEFAIPRVVARVNNPKNEWMFDETWGVDVQVSTPRIMASLVEEAVSVGILVRIFSFQGSTAAMYAVVIPSGSGLDKARFGDIVWPAHTVLAALLREGRPMQPEADDVITAGDELLLLVSEEGQDSLNQLRQMVCLD